MKEDLHHQLYLVMEIIQYKFKYENVLLIYLDGEVVKTLDVEVTPCTIRKPFIGGFRKKLSGIEYHDACTNTPKTKTVLIL